MQEKSFNDYALDALNASTTQLTFKDLFEKVVELSGVELDENGKKTLMSKLYTSLVLDGRFVVLQDNNWDLSSRHKFEETHVDMDEYYSDINVAIDDAEEKKDIEQEEGNDQDSLDDEDLDTDIDFDHPKKSDNEGF